MHSCKPHSIVHHPGVSLSQLLAVSRHSGCWLFQTVQISCVLGTLRTALPRTGPLRAGDHAKEYLWSCSISVPYRTRSTNVSIQENLLIIVPVWNSVDAE